MNNELHRGCRTCQNRPYMSNMCGRKWKSVSLTSRSEWSEYMGKWEDAVARGLAIAEKALEENPTKETKAQVKRLRQEQLSIRAQPLGEVIGSCPHYKQHTTVLPTYAGREEGGD